RLAPALFAGIQCIRLSGKQDGQGQRSRLDDAAFLIQPGDQSMLLMITNTEPPATDLGYLLRKHPARLQSFELAFGQAHVFYTEASDERCTAALLLDIDPVGLVRNRRGPAGESHALEQYVNDRPYVA